jgi:AsnC-type helix-turn-helix domain
MIVWSWRKTLHAVPSNDISMKNWCRCGLNDIPILFYLRGNMMRWDRARRAVTARLAGRPRAKTAESGVGLLRRNVPRSKVERTSGCNERESVIAQGRFRPGSPGSERIALRAFDCKILQALMENARASNVVVAQKVGLSESLLDLLRFHPPDAARAATIKLTRPPNKVARTQGGSLA